LEAQHIIPIYNPYEREPFLEMAAEAAPVPEHDFFLCVAALEPRKRHDRLLKAYKASEVDTPLLIMGKGKPENEAAIRRQIDELGLQDRVRMEGYHHNPYPWIARAKAMILTSDAEGLPRVLIEALLLHTPVISVDCPSGPKEILTQELA